MSSVICLVFLLVAGFIPFFLPASTLGYPTHGNSLFDCWFSSLKVFSVPMVLILLGVTRNILIKILKFLWGLWLSVLSLLILFRHASVVPQISAYGVILVGAVLVFSLGLLLFSTIEISGKKSKPDQVTVKA